MDLYNLDEEELLTMSKKDLRELIHSQSEELQRLRDRIRAQEDQIKQLSLHSLANSGLGLVDDVGLGRSLEENSGLRGRIEGEGFINSPIKGGGGGLKPPPAVSMLSRSPHTPPSTPIEGSSPMNSSPLRYKNVLIYFILFLFYFYLFYFILFYFILFYWILLLLF